MHRSRWAAGLLAVLFGLSSARAELFTYTIIQNQSQINLTAGGTLFGGAITATEQQANAITRYNGTIGVGVSYGGPAFPGEGAANAVNPTGFFNIPLQYTPNINGGAGTAAANYGLTLNAPVNFVIPTIPIPPELIAQFPFLPSNLSLGTLTAVVGKVALRDISLEILSAGQIPRTGNTFDANLTQIDITNGFADLNIAARLRQPDLLTKAGLMLVLGSIAGLFPDLGITVTTPGLFSLDIDVGIGFRVDISGLPPVPNMAVADGTITGLSGPPGPSTLTLPVKFGLDPTLLPPELGPILGDLIDLTFDFEGVLVATATIPEASSLRLIGMPLLAGGAWFVRRRRTPLRA
jgi:hypothetical protein